MKAELLDEGVLVELGFFVYVLSVSTRFLLIIASFCVLTSQPLYTATQSRPLASNSNKRKFLIWPMSRAKKVDTYLKYGRGKIKLVTSHPTRGPFTVAFILWQIFAANTKLACSICSTNLYHGHQRRLPAVIKLQVVPGHCSCRPLVGVVH